MKHTYSSGKSSWYRVAATMYGRAMGLGFCKKITEKNEETKHSLLHRDWKMKKNIILTYSRFEYVLEAS